MTEQNFQKEAQARKISAAWALVDILLDNARDFQRKARDSKMKGNIAVSESFQRIADCFRKEAYCAFDNAIAMHGEA